MKAKEPRTKSSTNTRKPGTLSPKSKLIKVIGTKQYIDPDTGEVQDFVISKAEERDFNFSKIWMRDFIAKLDMLGNQRMHVCFWIIDHINRQNELLYSQREIARQAVVSLDTVQKTLQTLLAVDFLKKIDRGHYIINPNVVFRGQHKNRLAVATIYEDPETAKATSVEEQLKGIESLMATLKRKADYLKGLIDLQNQQKGADDGQNQTQTISN